MSTMSSPLIVRRDFLRTCGASGLGLGFGFRPRRAAALPAEDAKVCAAVAEKLPDGGFKLIRIAMAPACGVDRYGIHDFAAASQCVREALAAVEFQCDVMLRGVVLAVGGAKIHPYEDGPAWEQILEWEEIAHANRGDGTLRCVGTADNKRAQALRIVRGAGTRIQNIIRCVEDIGVEIERLVFETTGRTS